MEPAPWHTSLRGRGNNGTEEDAGAGPGLQCGPVRQGGGSRSRRPAHGLSSTVSRSYQKRGYQLAVKPGQYQPARVGIRDKAPDPELQRSLLIVVFARKVKVTGILRSGSSSGVDVSNRGVVPSSLMPRDTPYGDGHQGPGVTGGETAVVRSGPRPARSERSSSPTRCRSVRW